MPQNMIYDKEGGREGVRQFLIFGWQEGEWWSGPPFLADIICEQPLLPERWQNIDRTMTEQWRNKDRTLIKQWQNYVRSMTEWLQNNDKTIGEQ